LQFNKNHIFGVLKQQQCHIHHRYTQSNCTTTLKEHELFKKIIHKLLGLSKAETGQYYGAKPPSRSLAKKGPGKPRAAAKSHKPAEKPEAKKTPTSKPTERNYNNKSKVHGKRKTQKNHSNKQNGNLNSRQQYEFKPKVIPPLPELVDVEVEEGKARFQDMNLDVKILAALQDLKFKYCTPIQEQCLPHTINGKDITGKAQTGTGKTAAFLISAFEHMLRNPLETRLAGTPRVLVMAPTRELAMQIHKDAEALSKYCGFNNLVVFGGMNHEMQKASLHHPVDILIGTPGRIIDYSRSGDLRLEKTEILVIDEADRMLDMGFMVDVRRIVAQVPAPQNRRTMFFSATFTEDITRLVDKWLVDPAQVEIDSDNKVAETIDQKFFSVLSSDKLPCLLNVIKNDDVERMIIFGNMKSSNERLADKLKKFGVKCEVLSGDVPQQKRIKILERFRAGTTKVVVATDVAARGIHVDSISHVVNYELPEKTEDYVHRIGRTGRAGADGTAISFICEYGAYLVQDLEETIGQEIKCEQPTEEMLKMPKRGN